MQAECYIALYVTRDAFRLDAPNTQLGVPRTSLQNFGAGLFAMMDVRRHKSVETVRGYIRRADAFKNHAGKGLL